MLKRIRPSKKGLVNIRNIDDNECFKWSLVRSLNPTDHQKLTKILPKKLDFKDIISPVKIIDIHKVEKKNSIGISVFGYKYKKKHATYVSKKCCEEMHVDILLTEKRQKMLCFYQRF